MTAPLILIVVAAAYVALAVLRIRRDGGQGPAARTWLIVAAVLGTVALWLWTRQSVA